MKRKQRFLKKSLLSSEKALDDSRDETLKGSSSPSGSCDRSPTAKERTKSESSKEEHPTGSSDDVQIVFHALIPCDEWNFEPDDTGHHKAGIYFGSPLLHSWTKAAVEMETISSRSNMVEMMGCLTLPATAMSHRIPYKYVVTKSGGFGKTKPPSDEWEFLRQGKQGGDVNRVLQVSNLRSFAEGVYEKYDGVIRPLPEPLRREKNPSLISLSTARVVEDRELAIEHFFPKWRGFCSSQFQAAEAMSAQTAIDRFYAVVDGLSNLPVVNSKRHKAEVFAFRPDRLSVHKVLKKIFFDKVAELSRFVPPDSSAAQDKVVSALSIAVIFRHYKFDVGSFGLSIPLTACFVLPFDLQLRRCPVFEAIKAEFPDKKLLLDAVLAVCTSLCRSAKPGHDWILAMPLVHFLSGAATPFEYPIKAVDHDKPDWWGLCGMDSREGDLKPLQKETKEAFENCAHRLLVLDPFLQNVILHACSFSALKDWIKPLHPTNVIKAIVLRQNSWSKAGKERSDLVKFLASSLDNLVILFGQITVCDEVTYRLAVSGVEAGIVLLSLLCNRRMKESVTQSILLTLIRLIFLYVNAVCRMEQLKVVNDEYPVDENLECVAGLISVWISHSTQPKDSRNYLKIWNEIVQCSDLLADERLQSSFQSSVEEELGPLQAHIYFIMAAYEAMPHIPRIHSFLSNCLERMLETAVINVSIADRFDQAAFNGLLRLAIRTCEEKRRTQWLFQLLYDISKGKGDDNLLERSCLDAEMVKLSEWAEMEIKRLEKALEEMQKERDCLLSSLAEKAVINEQLQERSESFERLQDRVESLSKENSDLRSSLADQVGRRALSDSDAQSEVEKRCRDLDETIKRLTSQLQSVRRDEARKETESSDRFNRLHKEYNNLRGVCQEYQKKNEKLQQYAQFLQIPVEDVEMTGFQMGQGSYGGVQVGIWCGCLVAVKELHECLKKDTYLRLFQQEMEICSRVRHPNILAICGVTFREGEPLRIITNLLEASLSEVIQKSSGGLRLREKVDLSVGMAAGIAYLHQLRPDLVLHGDIRSSNVLVTSLMEAQIADLGTARLAKASLSGGPQSPQYAAPERAGGNTQYADLYSLGVTIIELMTGELPVKESRQIQLLAVQHIEIKHLCFTLIDNEPRERGHGRDCLETLQRVQRNDEGYKKCPPKRMVKGKYGSDSGEVSLVDLS